MLLIFLFKKEETYQLKFINYDQKIHQYILFPKTINFRPVSLNQLTIYFNNSIYNFIYYLE
jgi:hypothetical protein